MAKIAAAAQSRRLTRRSDPTAGSRNPDLPESSLPTSAVPTAPPHLTQLQSMSRPVAGFFFRPFPSQLLQSGSALRPGGGSFLL